MLNLGSRSGPRSRKTDAEVPRSTDGTGAQSAVRTSYSAGVRRNRPHTDPVVSGMTD